MFKNMFRGSGSRLLAHTPREEYPRKGVLAQPSDKTMPLACVELRAFLVTGQKHVSGDVLIQAMLHTVWAAKIHCSLSIALN